MGKSIGVILAIAAWAASEVKGWGNLGCGGMGGVFYKPPTMKSQFVKPKKKKPKKK